MHKAKPVYEQHPIFFRLAEAAEGRISLLQENSLKKGSNIMASYDCHASAPSGVWTMALCPQNLKMHRKFAA